MYNVRLTKGDLINIFDLKNIGLAQAIFSFFEENGIELKSEYDLYYKLLETYKHSIAEPVTEDLEFNIVFDIMNGVDTFILVHYEDNNYAIKLSEEVKEELGR